MVKFLDKFLSKRNLATSAKRSWGSIGTVVIGGYLVEDEKDAALTGRTKYITYSDILANTAIVSAGIRYYLNLTTRAKWKVEPKEIDGEVPDEAKRLAELVEDIMQDMDTPWHRVIRRAAMYRFYGFSIQEWTAKKRDDGVIGYKDIMPRPQLTIERWELEKKTGKVLGVHQRVDMIAEEMFIPRKKFIYMVDDSLNDSPEGLGIFRNLAGPAARLSRYEQLEGYGFESDLRGTPIGRAPYAELAAAVEAGEMSQSDMDKRLEPFETFITNHIKNPALGMIVDSLPYQTEDEAARPSNMPQWDLQLLKAGATSQEAVALAIQRVNQEIARLLGVEGLLLGSNTLGSQALSSDKSKNFAMTVDSALLELSETFKKDFLNPLWELNGWDKKLIPEMKPEAIQFRNIEEITGALKDLASAGALIASNDPAVNDIRDMMGVSKQTGEVILPVQNTANSNSTSEDDTNGTDTRNE